MSITIEITGENLLAGLAAVMPSAGVDDTLPILTCVHFETRGDELFVATTDRYTLATYRLDTAEPVDGEVGANLQGRDAKELIAFARKAKRVPLQLTFDDDRELTVSDFERKVSYRLLSEAEFPKVWAIMPERRDLVFGVNREYIGRFAKAADAKDPAPLILSPNGLKPIRVEVGDRFVGAIMPVRLPDVTKVHPDAEAKVGDVKVVEVDGVKVAETRHVDLHPDEPADDDPCPCGKSHTRSEHGYDPDAEPEDVAEGEDGAEPTELDCPTCKGFGVVKGKPAADGTPRPFRTANGAATATTAVECPTCHGDRIAA